MTQASPSLPPASAQEIFDIVARHLLTQRERSTAKGVCLYRGPEGLKCAVGALIPDEVYRASFEGVPCRLLVTREPKLAWMLPHEDLLTSLQHLHDSVLVEHWRHHLLDLAYHWELSPAILQEFPND